MSCATTWRMSGRGWCMWSPTTQVRRAARAAARARARPRPGSPPAPRICPTGRIPSSWCGASGVGAAATPGAGGRRSPRPSRRCRRGCAPPPGYARPSPRAWKPGGRSTRSPPAMGCRGRPRSARWPPTPPVSGASPSRPRCWAWTRPASGDPAGSAPATSPAKAGGCAWSPGRPGSSTCAALAPRAAKACSDRSTVAPARRSCAGSPSATRRSGTRSRSWRSTRRRPTPRRCAARSRPRGWRWITSTWSRWATPR